MILDLNGFIIEYSYYININSLVEISYMLYTIYHIFTLLDVVFKNYLFLYNWIFNIWKGNGACVCMFLLPQSDSMQLASLSVHSWRSVGPVGWLSPLFLVVLDLLQAQNYKKFVGAWSSMTVFSPFLRLLLKNSRRYEWYKWRTFHALLWMKAGFQSHEKSLRYESSPLSSSQTQKWKMSFL